MTLEDLQDPDLILEVQFPGKETRYRIRPPQLAEDGSVDLHWYDALSRPEDYDWPAQLFLAGRRIGMVHDCLDRCGFRIEFDPDRFLVRYNQSPPVVNVGYLDPHEERVIRACDLEDARKWFADSIQRENPMARIIRVEPIE